MYCRYCGKSIAEDSDFCTYCGRHIGDTSSETNIYENEKAHGVRAKKARSVFNERSPLITMATSYIALGTFLVFNIEMAPFYGWWKFLAYIIEGVIAITLVVLTKRKIAEGSHISLKILSIIFSIIVILSSISLRIVYDAKVDTVEKDIPDSGTFLVSISRHTEYYSALGGIIYDADTSVKINDATDYAEITIGQPIKLEINVEADYYEGMEDDTLFLQPSDFIDGQYSTTKTIYLEHRYMTTVEVKLRKHCTFWEVIFY